MKHLYGKPFPTILSLLFAVLLCASASQAEQGPLMMATTTSTDNTGLLEYMAPLVKEATGIELKWVATGTGQALKLGENCDADVLMVHAPAAEKAFVEAGFGLNRRQFMYNDFIIIGPEADPAGIKGKDTCGAFKAVLDSKAVFVSRGDDSGTHKKELALWNDCVNAVPDKEGWYRQAGQGMLATINIAGEQTGYTLTDRGTYISYEANLGGNPPLRILSEGDQKLLNQYSVIEVNPERCPKAQQELARKFGDWLVSKEGQNAIAAFKLEGKQLFFPNAEGN
ncbi:MAG: substrate-binding domain-containing protein [Desulfobulbaceae bacterium]|jgi:tungstate transport system substrate-binding protein|nr:substrate-binding domain-containing protein [Desulfobulbaceae bacterium]MDY0350327.1 substrate-binding domain-containing protein [Desulfobulbaceae bacterium]